MVAIQKDVMIGNCRLILADAMAVLPTIGPVDHIISDPPYEQSLHDVKSGVTGQKMRLDGGSELRALDFAGIDEIRADFTELAAAICKGWFIVFCTVEGVARWADAINPSTMKYKRACIWVKPDSAPQMNGQGPAQGAECFVAAWAGGGFASWNAGGKRGVYTHRTNPPDRHGGHPTEKPWRLMSEMITDFTNSGDVILDPFMGSGTTLVAAARNGRGAVGIEKDAAYFEIACERVEGAYRQPDLFVPAPAAPVQEPLI